VDIDVSLTRKRTSRWQKGCSRAPEQAVTKGDVRGLDRRSDARLKRPRRSPAPGRNRQPRARVRVPVRKGGSSVGPKPAARRQARGCRRPDDRKVVRRRPRTRQNPSRGDLKGERRRVFPRRSADGLRR
jgi:hypothetical protein